MTPVWLYFSSGWPDLNRRPLAPHASTLPDCATPRDYLLLTISILIGVRHTTLLTFVRIRYRAALHPEIILLFNNVFSIFKGMANLNYFPWIKRETIQKKAWMEFQEVSKKKILLLKIFNFISAWFLRSFFFDKKILKKAAHHTWNKLSNLLCLHLN